MVRDFARPRDTDFKIQHQDLEKLHLKMTLQDLLQTLLRFCDQAKIFQDPLLSKNHFIRSLQ